MPFDLDAKLADDIVDQTVLDQGLESFRDFHCG